MISGYLEHDPIIVIYRGNNMTLYNINTQERENKNVKLKKEESMLFLDNKTILFHGDNGYRLEPIDKKDELIQYKGSKEIAWLEYLPKENKSIVLDTPKGNYYNERTKDIKYIVVRNNGNKLTIFEYKNRDLELINTISLETKFQYFVMGDEYIVVNNIIYDVRGTIIKKIDIDINRLHDIREGPDNTIFYFMTGITEIKIWDMKEMKFVKTIKTSINSLSINCIIKNHSQKGEYYLFSTAIYSHRIYNTYKKKMSRITITDVEKGKVGMLSNKINIKDSDGVEYIHHLNDTKILIVYTEERFSRDEKYILFDFITEKSIPVYLLSVVGRRQSPLKTTFLSLNKAIINNFILDLDSGKTEYLYTDIEGVLPYRTQEQIERMTDEVIKAINSDIISLNIKGIIAKFI